jgi:hypothetical protein
MQFENLLFILVVYGTIFYFSCYVQPVHMDGHGGPFLTNLWGTHLLGMSMRIFFLAI